MQQEHEEALTAILTAQQEESRNEELLKRCEAQEAKIKQLEQWKRVNETGTLRRVEGELAEYRRDNLAMVALIKGISALVEKWMPENLKAECAKEARDRRMKEQEERMRDEARECKGN